MFRRIFTSRQLLTPFRIAGGLVIGGAKRAVAVIPSPSPSSSSAVKSTTANGGGIGALLRNRKIIIGVTAGLSLLAIYLYRNPEKVLMKAAKRKFDTAYSYSAQKYIFLRMPEPKAIPLPSTSDGLKEAPKSVEDWSGIVNNVINTVEKSVLYKTVNYMRSSLIKYIDTIPDARTRLEEYRQVVPDSMELQAIIETQLQKEIEASGRLDTELLQENIVKSKVPYSINIRLIQMAILTFPGPIDKFIQVLQGTQNVNTLIDGLNVDPEKIQDVRSSIMSIKHHFAKHPANVQKYILEGTFTNLIDMISKVQPGGNNMYDSMLQKYVFDRFAQNPIIGPLTKDISTVFRSLPARIQARMIIGSLSKSDNDEITFLSTLLSNGGIVAIKLGQIISEDPKIPMEYRKIFSQLRDSNDQMPIVDFWSTIPGSIRSNITSIGKCLGVGSVKQVHTITLKNDSKNYAVACIRQGIEDDAIAVLAALENIKQIEGLVNRIRKLVYREMDLWLEYEAFEHLREKLNTSENLYISVPHVKIVTLNCLVRELADGQTLAKIFKNREDGKQMDNERDRVAVDYVANLHKFGLDLAFNRKFILCDLHLGNIVFDKNNKLNIFDPGQNDTITSEQSTALLWTFAALSDDKRMKTFQPIVVTKLGEIAKYKNGNKDGLTKSINKVYDTCYEIKDPKFRFAHLLAAMDKENVMLPSGFFATAKMLDIFMSQSKLLGFSGNVEKEIERLLRQRMSYMEMAKVGIATLRS